MNKEKKRWKRGLISGDITAMNSQFGKVLNIKAQATFKWMAISRLLCLMISIINTVFLSIYSLRLEAAILRL